MSRVPCRYFTFIDVADTTLPSWWPREVINMMKTEKPINNYELFVLLEEIKEYAILSKALEEYEVKESNSYSYVSCSLGK